MAIHPSNHNRESIPPPPAPSPPAPTPVHPSAPPPAPPPPTVYVQCLVSLYYSMLSMLCSNLCQLVFKRTMITLFCPSTVDIDQI